MTILCDAAGAGGSDWNQLHPWGRGLRLPLQRGLPGDPVTELSGFRANGTLPAEPGLLERPRRCSGAAATLCPMADGTRRAEPAGSRVLRSVRPRGHAPAAPLGDQPGPRSATPQHSNAAPAETPSHAAPSLLGAVGSEGQCLLPPATLPPCPVSGSVPRSPHRCPGASHIPPAGTTDCTRTPAEPQHPLLLVLSRLPGSARGFPCACHPQPAVRCR